MTPLKTPSETPQDNEKLIESVTAALNMTNQQLADELGISRATVENWRYHNTPPSADRLRAIVSLLVDKIHGMSRIIEMSASIGRQKQEERQRRREERRKKQEERDKPRRRIRKTSEQMPSN